MKNTYTITREDIITIIDALCDASLRRLYLANDDLYKDVNPNNEAEYERYMAMVNKLNTMVWGE